MRPSRELVLFVHGFAGDAAGTWRQVVELWPKNRPGQDLVFYGYDSVHQQINYSGSELRDFLNAFLAHPAQVINPTLQHLGPRHPWILRDSAFRYSKVVLVAHSLGAVLVRRALLESQNEPWLGMSRVIWFAPAHKGALLWKLILTSVTGVRFGEVVGAAAKFRFKALEGLEKGSRELDDLEKETLEVLGKIQGRLEPLVAAVDVWAQGDGIVIQASFAKDPPPVKFPGRGHVNVCKPSATFSRPMDEIEKIL
jgi:pimeloyl-ACP methyl ester carboxylesterase